MSALTIAPKTLVPGEVLDEKTFQTKLSFLSSAWDLRLDPNSPSPTKDEQKPLGHKCVSKLRFCYYKGIYLRCSQEFTRDATILQQKWIPRPVSNDQREELLCCLYAIAKDHADAWQKINGGTPRRLRQKIEEMKAAENTQPIPIALPHISTSNISPSSDSKRRRDDEPFADLPSQSKKQKAPEPQQRVPSPIMAPPRNCFVRRESMQSLRSANTSFNTSFAESVVSSVFSQRANDESGQNTQSTVPDEEPQLPSQSQLPTQSNAAFVVQSQAEAFITPQPARSTYGSSSFEDTVADLRDEDLLSEPSKSFGPAGVLEEEISQDLNGIALDAEAESREILNGIFPVLPANLERAHPCIIYEISRVFLHANVPLTEFTLRVTSAFKDYDALWRCLRCLPVLKEVTFPEKSSAEAWERAMDNSYSQGFDAVVFSGSFHFSSSDIFKLKLDPLKLDKAHRLGRRLGHDRFFEICIPQLSSDQAPRMLQSLGERGPEIIVNWFVETPFHKLIGRHWKPFHCKERETKRKNILSREPEDVETAFRLYFFATDGPGFVRNPDLVMNPAVAETPKMTVVDLFELIRPIEENMDQPVYKLFSRTNLALSRNSQTVVLNPEEIIVKEHDIMCGTDVMNDGAGEISMSLASKVAEKLGLTYRPTAFQGRLGEAKGLWIVDRHGDKDSDWITTYPSQRKWNRSAASGGPSDDPSHRTLEILKYSGPLKSARLNLQFLPLLVDRAPDKALMKESISKQLVQGLTSKVEEIQAATDDTRLFRKYLKEINSNTKERIKGMIAYKGGVPAVREERLNVFLDAGFSPRKLLYLKELAKDVFKSRTDELKEKLKISVGKSTYAFMIPDFWGVLAEGEVYLDFSSTFDDGESGLANTTLDGDEVLVARSPAHFISDIQKVKMVIKAELVGLKDVIVFSTRGNPSLANKLSGGDFDGDMAWICWEPSIVQNFVSAPVPPPRDLVKEGLIKQDKTTYKDLMALHTGKDKQIAAFLKKGLLFNLQPSMLGKITTFKEGFCYTQGNVDSREARVLSQLASDLVDQAKQGFEFDHKLWEAFRKAEIKFPVRKPRYKTEDPVANADHIIDHLKWIAKETIDDTLAIFHKSFTDPPSWDDDLVKLAHDVSEKANQNPEWKKIDTDLEADIQDVKKAWGEHWRKNHPKDKSRKKEKLEKEDLPEFPETLNNFCERYAAIQPHDDNALSQALLLQKTEYSTFELLKASTLFASYAAAYNRKPNVSKLVWWVAGKQLVFMKAMHSCSGLPPHCVIPMMWCGLGPNSSIIRRSITESQAKDSIEDYASVIDDEDLGFMDD